MGGLSLLYVVKLLIFIHNSSRILKFGQNYKLPIKWLKNLNLICQAELFIVFVFYPFLFKNTITINANILLVKKHISHLINVHDFKTFCKLLNYLLQIKI